ncbi:MULTISPECIES: YycH family regulatory protein [unclassified Solibacillus]|uniref:YycH family regulatory protein n=1 Tax=unclassified Solibacillus TaxID=2637870 RepID=UPI0030FC5F1D
MKYVEQVKSILLTFLVLLSIILTLLIWNYKPDYGLIEETQIEEVMVGDSKELKDVLKPYRLLYRQNDEFFGTVSPSVLNELYSYLQSWQTNELILINSNLSDEKINEIIKTNNRITMFFNGEVPLQVFSKVVSFNDKTIPEASFTRLILDWSTVETNNQLQLLFLNTEKRILYRAYVDLVNRDKFLTEVIKPAKDYIPYVEIERDSLRSLYVSKDPIQSTRYTYLIQEIPPNLFKSIVFTQPKIVQRNTESEHSERYRDDTSLMTVDTKNRMLNYVYPPAESIAPILSSRLLIDSFDYINDHGGFTGDYRFSSMNIDKHITEYQLFLHGLPIYSNSNMTTTTRIITTWGENRIFRYRRPYYSIATEGEVYRSQKELVSGEQVIEYIRKTDNSFKDIDEVVVGYYFAQDEAFILEPSWFTISNDEWTRISPEYTGGIINGLE